jgi:hypothetical protein
MWKKFRIFIIGIPSAIAYSVIEDLVKGEKLWTTLLRFFSWVAHAVLMFLQTLVPLWSVLLAVVVIASVIMLIVWIMRRYHKVPEFYTWDNCVIKIFRWKWIYELNGSTNEWVPVKVQRHCANCDGFIGDLPYGLYSYDKKCPKCQKRYSRDEYEDETSERVLAFVELCIANGTWRHYKEHEKVKQQVKSYAQKK